MAPLLSVIIPFYNGERFVKNIEKSFMAQKSKDFELICVDDGSKDGTLKALESFKERHSDWKINVIHKENGGVSSARNAGLAVAKGKYISFVDSDDYVTPDYIDVLKDNLDKHFEVLVFQQKRIHEKDKRVTNSKYYGTEYYGNFGIMTEFANNPTKYGVYNMFINKEYYDKHNFKFREGFKYYEDYEFMYRVFCLAKDILFTEHEMYFYILHKGSAMQSFNVDRITCIKALEDLRPFFKENMPEFLGVFDTWCVSRIYWSIMWQACIAFSFSDAMKFGKMLDIKNKVRTLSDVADDKVKYSTVLMRFSMPLYILAVKILGRSRSAIKRRGNLEEFKRELNESISNSSGL